MYFTLALISVVEQSFTKPIPKVIEINHVFDIRSWIKPHIAGAFKHHTQPHNFRIKKINGMVVMHYRQYTGDKWLPDGGLNCLKASFENIENRIQFST